MNELNFIFDTPSPYTREDMANRIITNQLNQLNYEFEMCMLDHKNNLLTIEEKLIQENGTEDDAYTLYMAEAEETREKSKGILGKLIDAVLKFFKSIKEFFFGKKDEEVADKAEFPEDPNALVKEANQFCKDANAALSGNEQAKGKFKKKAAIAGAVSGGILTTILGTKLVNKIRGNVEKTTDDVNDVLNKAKADIDAGKVPLEDSNLVKNIVNEGKSLGSRLLNCGKSFFTKSGKVDASGTYPETKSEYIAEVNIINKTFTKYKTKLREYSENQRNFIVHKVTGANKAYDELKKLKSIKNKSYAEQKRYDDIMSRYGATLSKWEEVYDKCNDLISEIDNAIKHNTGEIRKVDARSNDVKNINYMKSSITHIRKTYAKIESECIDILDKKKKK